jgi:hypothetical protein
MSEVPGRGNVTILTTTAATTSEQQIHGFLHNRPAIAVDLSVPQLSQDTGAWRERHERAALERF